ncbi:MAG: hypothetical protein IT243_01405 [Bacteroidia bacterium]|nr:hypothetical protein [Bacteroidia bacterium]
MNLFAHYYFSSKNDSSWYNAGLLLPDLLRIFTHKQQLQIIKNSSYESKIFNDLKDGVKRHLRDDSIFHNWEWFLTKNEELLLKLRKSKLDFKRDWILSHIFIEMVIDSYLSENYFSKIDKMYEDLLNCNLLNWKLIFENCNLKNFHYFESGYNNFQKIKYIYKYKDESAIIYSLNRIYESTGIGKFNQKQNDYLLILLKEIIPVIEYKITELKEILK